MRQLGIFAKYWQPGRVKTRLAADLGDSAACEIYQAFVETTISRLDEFPSRRVLCFWPKERVAEFEAIARKWVLQPQSPGDLGERMGDYFAGRAGR